MASTFQACDTIMEASKAKGDNEMMRIIRGISGDLVAAEAKYHKACYASYISQSNLKYTAFHEGDEETNYDSAFKELADDITENLGNGKAFDMATLLSKYKFLRKRV